LTSCIFFSIIYPTFLYKRSYDIFGGSSVVEQLAVNNI